MKFSPGARHRAWEEGLRAGVPDITVQWPSRGYCGAYLEIKQGSGTPRESQIDVAADCLAAGCCVGFAWSAEAGIEFLKWYFRE